MHLSSEDEDVVKCDRCGNYLIVESIDIHMIMCSSAQKQDFINPEDIKSKKSHHQKEQKTEKIQEDQDMIPCTLCGQLYPFIIYEEHEKQCMKIQMDKCKHCGVRLFKQDMKGHLILCQERNFSIQKQEQEKMIDLQNIIKVVALSKVSSNQLDNTKGLTNKQIGSLSSSSITKPQDCSICYAPMKNKRLLKLNCSHIFHRSCLVPWLKANPLCPMCRTHTLKK